MKIYALRTEDPAIVLSKFISSNSQLNNANPAYDKFLSILIDALAKYSIGSKNTKIEVQDYKQIEEFKKSKIKSGLTYINLDSQSNFGIDFAVCRLFDFESGERLGITSRPGYIEMDAQLANIQKSAGNKIGVIEDDIFTGGTIKFLADYLIKAGNEVDSIICGISTTKFIGDIPIDSAKYYAPDDLLENTDPRDYIIGSTQGGLVVTYMQNKFRVPYCLPFSDVTARASIAKNKAVDFSKVILHANLELHAKLGSSKFPAALFFPKSVFEKYKLNEFITIDELINSLISLLKLREV